MLLNEHTNELDNAIHWCKHWVLTRAGPAPKNEVRGACEQVSSGGFRLPSDLTFW